MKALALKETINRIVSWIIAPVAYDSVTVTVPSVAHGGNSSLLSVSATKTGYVPMSIVGWNWDSGTRQNWGLPWVLYLNGNTVNVRICNTHATDSMNGVMRIYLVYRKVGVLRNLSAFNACEYFAPSRKRRWHK